MVKGWFIEVFESMTLTSKGQGSLVTAIFRRVSYPPGDGGCGGSVDAILSTLATRLHGKGVGLIKDVYIMESAGIMEGQKKGVSNLKPLIP